MVMKYSYKHREIIKADNFDTPILVQLKNKEQYNEYQKNLDDKIKAIVKETTIQKNFNTLETLNYGLVILVPGNISVGQGHKVLFLQGTKTIIPTSLIFHVLTPEETAMYPEYFL